MLRIGGDVAGALAALVTGQHLGGFFRLSPDETKLATELGDIAMAGRQLHVLDARTGMGSQLAQDWSMDGRLLAYEERSPSRAAQRQVSLLSLAAERAPYVLLDAPFSTSIPRFSPVGSSLRAPDVLPIHRQHVADTRWRRRLD